MILTQDATGLRHHQWARGIAGLRAWASSGTGEGDISYLCRPPHPPTSLPHIHTLLFLATPHSRCEFKPDTSQVQLSLSWAGLGSKAFCLSLWTLILSSLSTPVCPAASLLPFSPASLALPYLLPATGLIFFTLILTWQQQKPNNKKPTLHRYCSAINRNKWLIHWWMSRALCWMGVGGGANCKRLHTIWFNFYKIF